MAIALVTNTSVAAHSGGTSGAVNTTGGVLLTAGLAAFPAASVSDSKGNVWTSVGSQVQFWTADLQYVNNPTVGSGHTFTLTGTYCSLVAAAWSGTNTSSPFDAKVGASGGSGTFPYTFQAGSITPAVANSLVVAQLVSNNGTNGNPTIDSGFTVLASGDGSGPNIALYGNAYLVPDTAAVNPTWSNLSGAGLNTAAINAVFKPAAASGGGPLIAGGELTHGILIRAGRLAA